MLRQILKHINPYKKGTSQKEQSLWWRLRWWVFSMSISTLKNFYRRYGYLDIIHIGNVEFRQSKRDLEYEEWLSQLGIDIRPHFHLVKEMPISISHQWWRPFYKFFHMELVTIIIVGKNEVILNRTHDLTLISKVKGHLRISDDTDILQRSEFKAIVSNLRNENVTNRNISEGTRNMTVQTEERPLKPKGRITVSLGEARPFERPINEPVPPRENPTIIQVQGAEIDESF